MPHGGGDSSRWHIPSALRLQNAPPAALIPVLDNGVDTLFDDDEHAELNAYMRPAMLLAATCCSLIALYIVRKQRRCLLRPLRRVLRSLA